MAAMPSESGARGGSEHVADVDATRRTRLATERTQLAWWRTGLTALAVGVGIGRVIPELGEELTEWPYVAVGVAFAVYGVALIWHGNLRARAVGTALERGAYAEPESPIASALAVAGVGLGLATGLLILLA
jgi:putative membrane protein